MRKKSFLSRLFETAAAAYVAFVLSGTMFVFLFMMDAGRQLVPSWVLYTSLALFAVGVATGRWARNGKGLVVGALVLAATFGTLGMGEFFGAGADEGNRFAAAQRDLAGFMQVFLPLLAGAVAAIYPVLNRLAAKARESAAPSAST